MKILVAVPTFETICPETFKSIWDLDTEHELYFEFVKGYDCAVARNMIAELCIKGDYDYVLMVDSDMIIPGGTLNVMLDDPVDVCFGAYPRKNNTEGKTTLIKPNTKNYEDSFYMSDLKGNQRISVKGGGFGCVLINRKVIEKLAYPWFKYVSYNNGTFLSEDYYFCSKAREAGFKLEAATGVKCGHLVRKFQYD